MVTDHACARRAEGAPVERVLAEVDGLARRVERLEGSPDGVRLLMRRVRLWSLAAYVDEPELRNAPRFY
jgi:uncharacterized protein (DUF2342 family)